MGGSLDLSAFLLFSNILFIILTPFSAFFSLLNRTSSISVTHQATLVACCYSILLGVVLQRPTVTTAFISENVGSTGNEVRRPGVWTRPRT